jgi:nitroreductase
MVRSFERTPVERAVIDRIMSSVLHAPSAGFAQGIEFVVLDDDALVDDFHRVGGHADDPHVDVRAPVIVLVLSNPDAYTRRYAAPDKIQFGLDKAENWLVPYWDVDAGMAAMLILLAVIENGLGAYFAGVGDKAPAVLERFGIPHHFRLVGFVGLGHPTPVDQASAGASAFTQRRRPVDELVHRNGW